GLAEQPAAAHRAVVTGADRETLLSGLDAVAADMPLPAPTAARGAGPVLVFPGQGWQWPGMGRGLLDSSPVFGRTVTEVSAVVEELAGWSVLQVLREGRALDRVDVVQPAMFAVMVGLARIWQELGVEPAAVVGHSQGEIAAACVAGVLDLREATRVVVTRSAAVRTMAGQGAMVSVAAGAGEVAGWLPAGWSVAAVNGPGSTVVCGPASGVSDLVRRCEAEGARSRVIPVDYASHSADVERIRDRVVDGLGTVVCRAGRIPLYSTVLAVPVDGPTMGTAYWYDNLRRPVRFQETVEALARAGHSAFVECGAHPVLAPAIEETLDALALPDGERPAVLGTLRRDDDGPARLHEAAAMAWTRGLDVRWNSLLPAAPPVAPPPPEPADPPAEAGTERRFWQGVGRGETDALAAELGLDDEQAAALAVVLPSLAQWRQLSREQATVDTWRYRETWRPATSPVAEPPDGQEWLVAVPEGWISDPFVTTCLAALPGSRPLLVAKDASRADLAEELRRVEDRPFAGVVSLLALDEAPHLKHPAVPAGLLATVALLQALDDCGLEARYWSITRAAVAAASGDRVEHPLQAHVAGLSRAVGVENPARLAGLVDLPAEPDEACARGLRAVLAAPPVEDQVAVRHDGVRVRRLVRDPQGDGPPGRSWSPRGTTLVTGGTGALGGHVARWLARQHAPHLLLLSRSGPDAAAAGTLREELLKLGARRVTVASCDVSDPDALSATLETLSPEEPLTAVFHTAGVVDDAPVTRMTGPQTQEVLAPKTAGALALHEATLDHELSAFVVFSSFSSMLPNVGQGAYAAANAHLDAFARWRRASGRPTLSVSWGAWAGEGMAAGTEFTAMLSRGGMDLMTAHLAVTALRQALDHDDTTVMIAHLDWARFAELFAAGRRYPLVEDLLPAGAAPMPAPDLPGRLAGLSPQQRYEELLTAVCREVAVVLGHRGAQDVLPDQVFRDIGFDSVTAIELRNRLTAVTGLRVQATAVFDHPTPEALTGHLLEQLAPDGTGTDTTGPDRFDAMDVHDLVRTARRATS
ncbi:SDR family NAD(P)-dependent oxidoreductase, partial [Streptomyces sp. NPDC047072]|uniref:SDR family NAD(P)-dependent oxidoreductase n=1 Tax=Streptomyces sp. NPDC047072 TaxID=3154809 RepID=UPI0033DC2866